MEEYIAKEERESYENIMNGKEKIDASKLKKLSKT
jgi:hypothetical protein